MCMQRTDFSPEHERLLLDLLVEQLGRTASRECFAEALLATWEEISGFERLSPARARHLVRHYWSKYLEQEDR